MTRDLYLCVILFYIILNIIKARTNDINGITFKKNKKLY